MYPWPQPPVLLLPNSLRAPVTSFLESFQRPRHPEPRNDVPATPSPTAWASKPDPHLKGLVGTDILPISSLPGPAGSKAVCTLQALPKEIQVEEDIVVPTQASFQGQKHKDSEGIGRAADVDNWGERSGKPGRQGVEERLKPGARGRESSEALRWLNGTPGAV